MTATEKDSRKSTILWMVALGALCLIVRLVLLRKFGIETESDTLGYRELASAIRGGTMASDQGFRTPGFPLLLLLTGMNDWATVAVQIVLSIGAILLLFDATRIAVKSMTVAVIVAGIYGLWPLYARWDVTILSESLATSLTIACFWACARHTVSQRNSWIISAGTLAAFASLTRPNLVPLCLAMPLWAIVASEVRLKSDDRAFGMRAFGLAMLPALILVGGWSAYNRERLGWFTISTVSGLGMTDVTGDILAELPKGQDAALDAYVSSSKAFRKQNGTRNQAVWSVLPKMTHASHKTFAEVSHDLMLYHLIAMKTHPEEYVSAVTASYKNFWTERTFAWLDPGIASKLRPEATASASADKLREMGWVGKVLPVAVGFTRLIFLAFLVLSPLVLIRADQLFLRLPLIGRWLLGACALSFALFAPELADAVACSVFFGLSPIGLIASFRIRSSSLLWLIVAFAWMMSLLTSAADYGKARYNVPIAPLVFVGLAICASRRDTSASPRDTGIRSGHAQAAPIRFTKGRREGEEGVDEAVASGHGNDEVATESE